MQERFAKRCKTSTQKRNNRILAASGAEDQRFADEKTMEARAVFTTSDFNYDDYKHRATQWAARHKWQLFWIPTQDTAACVVAGKWSTYHYAACGKLYGMLPIAEGMPMSLFEDEANTLQKHTQNEPTWVQHGPK